MAEMSNGNADAGLREMVKSIQKMAHGEGAGLMANAMGAEMVALVKHGFDTSTDPYGNTWKPVLRGGLPLRKTGRLRNAFFFDTRGGDVELLNNTDYAALQNFGTYGLPRGRLSAHNRKALSFRLGSARGRRGDQVFAKSVVIPGRPMVPREGDLPERWESRLRAVAELVLQKLTQGHG